MAKILIQEETLDEFTQVLQDVGFAIKLELNSTNYSKKKIKIMIDQLFEVWNDVYNPVEITISKSLRSLYGQYIQAKKSGDLETAADYLKSYLMLKNRY